jgi:hypothetical protein
MTPHLLKNTMSIRSGQRDNNSYELVLWRPMSLQRRALKTASQERLKIIVSDRFR